MKADRKSALSAVLAVSEAEKGAIAVGDADAYLSILADSCIYMPPNVAAKEGKELRDWLRDFLRTMKAEWIEFSHGRTEISGSLAYHDYSYVWKVTPRAGGQGIVGRGKGIQVFERCPDGSWKLARNIWNANPI
jgi:ketosteroid isomerase-like protein